VFRLYDTRTGQAEQIKPAPGGLLRLWVRGPDGQRPALAGDLRALVVADLIGRNAEHRHRLTVLASLVTGQGDPGSADKGGDADAAGGDEAFRGELAALNLRAAGRTAGAAGTADPVSSGEIIVGSCLLRTGPVLFEGREMAATKPPLTLPALAERGLDPLALRLAFLSGRYREPADLTWDALRVADRMLRLWRERVAEWAESPSKPMCAEATARLGAAFDDDLDTPAALQVLSELERDPEIPPGSKFESFVDADQLLALDLPSQIGRVPLPRNDSPS
jgi:cysteinyl-tRNA synthetase